MSIHDIADKIKGRVGLDPITMVNIGVIVLVGICAFGLGRLSVESKQSEDPIVITSSINQNSKLSNLSNSNSNDFTSTEVKGKYVASKNGKLYYTVNCSGANRIKEENKVWFQTPEEAEKLGLTFSTSCK